MKLLTLTGPSCSGKTTLLNQLVDKHGFTSVVSHTTRPMRLGEVEGKDYYFINQSTFDAMANAGGFMEYISFSGYSYGVSAEEMARVTKDGKIAVLIVEPIGLGQIKKYCVNHKVPLMSIYVTGPLTSLIARYINRMEGEVIGPEMAKRHAKRIESLIYEHKNWCVSHPFEISISVFNEDTQNNIIKTIVENEFVNGKN